MTNQNLTFNTLDSYFLNTGSMKLNIGYLRDSITAYFDVTERHTTPAHASLQASRQPST